MLEKTRSKEKDNRTPIVLGLIIVILIIALFITFKINLEKIKSLENSINNTNQNINALSQETNQKISELTDSLKQISNQQSSLQSQLSKIKAETSSDFSGIIEEKIKGVVTIKTDVAQGTGFLITDEGYVVTNAHVLEGAKYANIYDYQGTKYSASLIGYDLNIDIAVLKIIGSFSYLTFGDSDNVRIGEKVIAIGNPLGLSFSVSEGIISAIDREGSNGLNYYFQTDAALNPGNSGGPLIDTNGEVIGINNFKVSGENLGFTLEGKYVVQTINSIALSELNQTII